MRMWTNVDTLAVCVKKYALRYKMVFHGHEFIHRMNQNEINYKSILLHTLSFEGLQFGLLNSSLHKSNSKTKMRFSVDEVQKVYILWSPDVTISRGHALLAASSATRERRPTVNDARDRNNKEDENSR